MPVPELDDEKPTDDLATGQWDSDQPDSELVEDGSVQAESQSVTRQSSRHQDTTTNHNIRSSSSSALLKQATSEPTASGDEDRPIRRSRTL